MKLEYFRFLLTPVREPELPLLDKLSRDEVLSKIFPMDKQYMFQSGKAEYVLAISLLDDKRVFGRIGKHTSKTLHESPDKGFKVKSEEDWPGSYVFINLSDEKETGKTIESGQIIALQINREAISNSTNCLRALADKINSEIVSFGFYVSINPVLKERMKFWSVIDENRGIIRKVVLTYTPPNIFNLKNKLEDDLREANQTFNTTSTQIVLENDAGKLEFPKDDPLLAQSAEYIDLGNGGYAIHLTRGKKVIRSEDGVKSEVFEGDFLTIEGAREDDLKEILASVFGGQRG